MKTIRRLKPNLTRNDALAALSSGLLLAAVFPPWQQAWLIAIALTPVLMRALGNDRLSCAWLGFLTGVVYHLTSLYWIAWATLPGMIVLSVYLSLWFLLPFLALAHPGRFWLKTLAFALVWWLVEWIRTQGVMSFSWGFLGHAYYQTSAMRQAVDWLGVSAMSLLIAGFNAGVALAVKEAFGHAGNLRAGLKHPRQPAGSTVSVLLCATILIIAQFIYGYTKQVQAPPKAAPYRVALIQGGFTLAQKSALSIEEILAHYLELSQQALDSQPDLIIWPESTIPYPLNWWPDGLERIWTFVNENDVELLTGCIHGVETEGAAAYYNRAWLFSPETMPLTPTGLDAVQRYDKVHLVPYGEWIPLGAYWPFYHIETLIEEAGAGLFERGSRVRLFETRAGHRFSVMICFESTLAWHSRQAKQQGADFLVNITYDAWFGRSAGLRQHLLQSQYRAAETGLPLLRAANSGITGEINRRGQLIGRLPIYEPGYYLAQLRLPPPKRE